MKSPPTDEERVLNKYIEGHVICPRGHSKRGHQTPS